MQRILVAGRFRGEAAASSGPPDGSGFEVVRGDRIAEVGTVSLITPTACGTSSSAHLDVVTFGPFARWGIR